MFSFVILGKDMDVWPDIGSSFNIFLSIIFKLIVLSVSLIFLDIN